MQSFLTYAVKYHVREKVDSEAANNIEGVPRKLSALSSSRTFSFPQIIFKVCPQQYSHALFVYERIDDGIEH